MVVSPQPATTPLFDPADFCGVQWGVLGRVATASGVQILATHGMPNGKTINQIKIVKWVLGYSLSTPRDTAIGRPGRSFQSVGHLNFYSPGMSFRLRGSGPMTMSMCFLSPNFLAGLSEVESGFKLSHLDLLSNIQSERLAYLGRVMFREATQPGFASSLFAEAIGMEIALEVARYDSARCMGGETHRGGLAPWRMKQLESYIYDNIGEKLTLKELALVVGLSVRHLSRAVLQAKGVSLHRWIGQCRFAEARRLLAETDLPIQEIALRCAFQNAGSFSTAFLAMSGFPPSEFRQLTTGSSHLARLGAFGYRESLRDVS
jgi:AraC family transcriptional regulator